MSKDLVFNYQKVFAKVLSKFGAPKQQIGTVALALVRPPKDRDRSSKELVSYKAAFAFCNVADQFSKKKAQLLTTGRLKSTNPRNSFTFRVPGDTPLKEVMRQAYSIALSKSNIVGVQSGSNNLIYFSPRWLLEANEFADGVKFVPGFDQ